MGILDAVEVGTSSGLQQESLHQGGLAPSNLEQLRGPLVSEPALEPPSKEAIEATDEVLHVLRHVRHYLPVTSRPALEACMQKIINRAREQ